MGMKQVDLNQLILTIADGDPEFATQLTLAIKQGLEELQAKYTNGIATQSNHELQQIRHKLKPTLIMFEFEELIEELNSGIEILDKYGFGEKVEEHFVRFELLINEDIEVVNKLITA